RSAPSKTISFRGVRPGGSPSWRAASRASWLAAAATSPASSIHPPKAAGTGPTRGKRRAPTNGWRAPRSTPAAGGQTGSSGSARGLASGSLRHRWAAPRIRPWALRRGDTCSNVSASHERTNSVSLLFNGREEPMAGVLSGKSGLVTGGGRAIGSAVAPELGRHGANRAVGFSGNVDTHYSAVE